MKRRLFITLISELFIFTMTSTKSTVKLLQVTAIPTTTNNHIVSDLWTHVNKTCLTTDGQCDVVLNMQHLQQLESYMNHSSNPCVNFHEFACGNWRSEHMDYMTTFKKLASGKVTQNLTELFEYWLGWIPAERAGKIEQHLSSIRDREPYKIVIDKMLHYFRVCLAGDPNKIVKKLHLTGYLEQMQANQLFNFSNRNWQDNLAKLAQFGYSEHFIRLQVKQRNASYFSMTIMPHMKMQSSAISLEVYNQILRNFTTKPYEQLNQEFEELERGLARAQAIACYNIELIENNDCDSMQTHTVAQLQSHCNAINWRHYLSITMAREVQATDLVWVEDIGKIRAIVLFLQTADAEILFLYTLVRFFTALKEQPHNPMKAGISAFNCVKHMRKLFFLPMTYLYERVFYSQTRTETNRIVNLVFDQLKNAFRNILKNNRMEFGPTALRHLNAKLDSLRLNIGNLPVNASDQFYVDYVRELNLTENIYLNNLIALKHFYAHQHKFADATVNSIAFRPWLTFNLHSPDFPDIIDASPYYFVLSNVVVIPHGYLQPPYFDLQFWSPLIFGDLATTLGHELTHAFDNNFIHYDNNGNMLDDKDIEENPKFLENLKCMNTDTDFVSERIADISGTHVALIAFAGDNNFMRYNGKLFFLQFAQFFCGTTSFADYEAMDPYHDTGSLRLNYTVAHTPAFAEVFNCPPGSPMNPQHRCEMW